MTLSVDAVAALYRDEQPGLVRLAAMLTGRPADADALVHDCFVNLLRREEMPNNAAAFLRTSVTNACRSWHRRGRVRDRHEPTLRATATVTVEAEFDEMSGILDRLPARQRMAVVLRYYENCTGPEIAERLGCRPGTVKSLLNRALEALREELTP